MGTKYVNCDRERGQDQVVVGEEGERSKEAAVVAPVLVREEEEVNVSNQRENRVDEILGHIGQIKERT